MSFVLLALGVLTQEDPRVPATVTVPPVDREAPAVLRTATFALG